MNVHEAARFALRKAIAADPSGRFRTWSEGRSCFFKTTPRPLVVFEWIYHLLCAEPELGATTLEKQEREWSRTARPEDRYALAAALGGAR